MTSPARGTFETQATPHPPYDEADGVALGRMSIEKRFEGDLVATSHVEMIAARTAVPASAGYVALERVRGTLHGRAGSFVLQHSGTMNRGVSSLTVTVVPDSGTGELKGLSGAMTIDRQDGKHLYVFDCSLPDA